MDQNETPNSEQSSDAPPMNSEEQSDANQAAASESMSAGSAMDKPQDSNPEPQVFSPDSSNATSMETASTSEPMPAAAMPSAADNKMTASGSGKKFGLSKMWRKVAIICAVVIVLLGGSAAAFFGVYLPSKPWYILDTGLKNTLNKTNLSINTTANIATSSGLAFKLSSLTATNLNNKTADENLSVTIAGATIPVEFKLVNSNLYFKFGDLSSVASLASLAGASLSSSGLGAVVTPLLTQLSNQWVAVDSTLLEQSKAVKCLLTESWTLSNNDANYLTNSYLNQPFFTVKSSSSDTLNSQSEDKMSVSMNDNQAAKYIQNLSKLEAFKSFDQCDGVKATSSSTSSLGSLADGKTTPLTFWVNKSTHLIDKVEFVSSSQGTSKGMSGTVDASFSYGAVNIQAPANAIPVTQLLAQLEQGLSKSGNSSALNSLTPLLTKL